MECVLEIVKESSVLLCGDLPMLMFVTLLLIFPVSSLTLSQVLTNGDTAHKIEEAASWFTQQFRITNKSSWTKYNGPDDGGAFVNNSNRTLAPSPWSLEKVAYGQVLETLAAQATLLPVVLTLAMCARVATWHVVRARWEGRRPKLDEILSQGPSTWARLVSTHLLGHSLVLALAILVLVARGAAVQLMGALGLDRVVRPMFDVVLVVLFMLLYPHVLAVLRMSIAVAGLHESRARSGCSAILASLALLKRRRIRPGLLLYLISCAILAAIEFVFQCRILGRSYNNDDPNHLRVDRRFMNTGHNVEPNVLFEDQSSQAGSSLHRFLEAPILVFAHAFVTLLDIIASFCFFNACTEASVEEYLIMSDAYHHRHHGHRRHHHNTSITYGPSHSSNSNHVLTPSAHYVFHIPDLDLINDHHLEHGHRNPLLCDGFSSQATYEGSTHGGGGGGGGDNEEEGEDRDHFSVAVEILEKHCRKLNLYISTTSSSSSSNFAID